MLDWVSEFPCVHEVGHWASGGSGMSQPPRSSSFDRCPCEQQSVLQNPAAAEHPEEAEASPTQGVLRG